MPSRRATKRDSFSERFTTEFTSGQMVIGIVVSIFFFLAAFLLGIIIGKYQRYPNEERTAMVAPGLTPTATVVPVQPRTAGVAPAPATQAPVPAPQTQQRPPAPGAGMPAAPIATPENAAPPADFRVTRFPEGDAAAAPPSTSATTTPSAAPSGDANKGAGRTLLTAKPAGTNSPAKPNASPAATAPAEAPATPPAPGPLAAATTPAGTSTPPAQAPPPPPPADAPETTSATRVEEMPEMAPPIKPAQPEAPKPTDTAPTASGRGKFLVQVAALGSNTQAQSLVGKLSKRGLRPEIQQSEDGKYYRVILVGYASQADATRAANQLKQEKEFAGAYVRSVP